MSRKFSVPLTGDGLRQLAAEFDMYAEELEDLSSKCISTVLKRAEAEIRDGFAAAPYAGTNDTVVTKEDAVETNFYRIIVSGNAAPYIEFGAGINQPDYPGEIPTGFGGPGSDTHEHFAPVGNDTPREMKPIEKDSGYWGYYGDPGSGDASFEATSGANITEGTPPAAILYRAKTAMETAITQAIEEAYKKA